MNTTFSLEVSFGQIAVFGSKMDRPFNDWTQRHVAQGFAWRPGSVSFRSLLEAGTHSVEMIVTKRIGELSTDTVRAVEVPFAVPESGEVEIASISSSVTMKVPPGDYLLRCEFLDGCALGIEAIRLTFAREEEPHFAIVRADNDLTTQGELLKTAQPAPG